MKTKKNTVIRKEEIVHAALKVISNKGVKELTIAAIAETAGMCEANIYRHFKSKDDIYISIAEFIGITIMGKASTIAAGSRKPLEKLEAIFFSHITNIKENPGMPRFMFSEDVHLSNRKLAEKISVLIKKYIETLASIIAAGMNEGDFRQGLSSRGTALTIFGIIQSTAFRWTNSRASFDIRKDAEKLWINFLNMVQ